MVGLLAPDGVPRSVTRETLRGREAIGERLAVLAVPAVLVVPADGLERLTPHVRAPG
ncbi:hypothetical protein [Streptosporangium sp. NPDC002524]|uniref:hypothetical protein n=1 Tax=Streptosporangium sp. NPDC002524 TaxID=3154537 RepID=UPI00332E45B8